MGIFDWLFGVPKTTPTEKKETIIKKSVVKKPSVKTVKYLETTHDLFENLNEKELFLDKDNKSFSGFLIINKTVDNGKIECEYKNGKKDGEEIQYDKENENKIRSNKFYINGLLNGPMTYWWEKYKNGKAPKTKEFDFGNSELSSLANNMLKKHDIMMQINYKDGLMHGKWIDHGITGGINYELNFKDGKKDGTWRGYFSGGIMGGQGALKQVSFYKDDKHVSSKYYDFDGDEISKKEALNDEEWGEEIWEQDQEF